METTRGSRQAMVTKAATYGVIAEKARIWVIPQGHKKLALVYLLLVLNILDVLTTHVGLQLGALEGNPIMAGLIGGVGEAATYAIKLSVVLAVALLICSMGKLQALKWLNLVMGATVVSNLAVFAYSFAG